jgi:purine-binding chemotaxis protein CheW
VRELLDTSAHPFPTMPSRCAAVLNLRGSADAHHRSGTATGFARHRTATPQLHHHPATGPAIADPQLGMLVDEVLMVEDIQRQDIEAAPPLSP